MKTNKLIKIAAILLSLILMFNCSDDSSSAKSGDDFKLRALSSADSSIISNANVVLYNADNNEAVGRNSTDSKGVCSFDINEGNYYVRISAQGFKASPPQNNTPIPFTVTNEEQLDLDFYLNPQESPQPGQISGFVNPVVNNVLIIAGQNATDYTTVTGPDGYFVLYNLPYGSYNLQAFKEGFEADTVIQYELNSANPNASVTIDIKQTNGAVLKGKVTFLASENYFVDISLVNPATFSAIPGLSTFSDTGSLDYQIDNIPSGTFQAWASFKNDGYVMDPDWIYRNPAVLTVHFTENDSIDLNFSVTNSVTILGPTNPVDSIYAIVADSSLPTFSWLPYSSAKEYIIEVRKLNGDIIWGGYNMDGSVNHPQLDQHTENTVFNFDGSAIEALIPGEIYQWKVYADNGRDPGVQTLISSSEDQLGIFTIE